MPARKAAKKRRSAKKTTAKRTPAKAKAAKKRTTKRRVSKRRGNKRGAVGREKEICFTIMPFGGWLDEYYETIYCPAIEAAGLKPRRADDLFRPGTIVTDIWDYTRQAKLLLADLTGKNPNVFYELGLAHALKKPAILVAESMDDIPFDPQSAENHYLRQECAKLGENSEGKNRNVPRRGREGTRWSAVAGFFRDSFDSQTRSDSSREGDPTTPARA
jgi:hypothetical protein